MVDWSPTRRLVSTVSNAVNAAVTTTVAHGYSTGQYVLLNVEDIYGMTVVNGIGQITVTSDTEFSMTLDTSTLLPFVAPGAGDEYTPAQVTVISTLGGSNRFRNSTPGSPG